MFKRRRKSFQEEIPGTYVQKFVRTYYSEHSHTIDSIPLGLFDDIDKWLVGMGLDPIVHKVSKFAPLSLCAGDSVEFTFNVSFPCGKAALLAKLAFGGTGQMAISVDATV